VKEVVLQIQAMNPPGRFLMKTGDFWSDIGDDEALKKTRQRFVDAMKKTKAGGR
jgi:hypothetical protein